MNNKQFTFYPWPNGEGKAIDTMYPGKKIKRKISSFMPINVKSCSAKLVNSIRVYQSFCWHCERMWFKPYVPKVVREGLKCGVCGKINRYEWSDKQYKQTLYDYDQKEPILDDEDT